RIFEAVFVEAERRRWIGGAREPKREVHVVDAEVPQPDRLAIAEVELVLRLDRLVDNIPGPDLSTIAGHQRGDVALERRPCLLGTCDLHHPGWIGRIPHECVTVRN